MAHDLITFEVLYYNGGPDWAPNRVVGREFVNRRDLSAAIKWGTSRLGRGIGAANGAHGLYVHKLPRGHTAELVARQRGVRIYG